MKTIADYLAGDHDEELRVLCEIQTGFPYPYSTSLDACHELLMDLTEEELQQVALEVCRARFPDSSYDYWNNCSIWEPSIVLLRATVRQICVAYLIVKGVLK